MGAALTKNILSITTDVVAKLSTKILLKTKLSTDSSQVISVKDVHGDVHIIGNKFYQKATVNMKTLMKALSSESAQQELMTEITQTAKSLASGINLGQYTDAENLMNLLVKSTITLISDMEASCGALINQDQEIIIERVKGNVYIQNNIFSQVQNILQDCVERATSNSDAFQQLEEKLKQEASAKSEGISEWILVAILAVLLGVPVLGGVIGGKYILKFIFPLIFITGAVLLVLYFTWTYETIKVIGYSQGIQTLCGLTPTQTFTSKDSTQTHDMCVSQDACNAYEWQSYTTKFVPEPPKGYIYDHIPKSCITQLTIGTPDSSPVTTVPKFTTGMGIPTGMGSNGDVYLDKQSSFWYQFNEQSTWVHMGTFVSGFKGIIDWGTTHPDTGAVGQYFVVYDPSNPIKFSLLQLNNGTWVQVDTFKGPGLIPKAQPPNVTGYKHQAKRKWALYGGITGLVVGAIGSIYMITDKTTDKTTVKTKA